MTIRIYDIVCRPLCEFPLDDKGHCVDEAYCVHHQMKPVSLIYCMFIYCAMCNTLISSSCISGTSGLYVGSPLENID